MVYKLHLIKAMILKVLRKKHETIFKMECLSGDGLKYTKKLKAPPQKRSEEEDGKI